MPECERKSRWNMVVCCIVLLPVLYWFSAPVTLWGWVKSGHPDKPPPEFWSMVYEPVLWAAESSSLHPVIMRPFEWLGVDGNLAIELLDRFAERRVLTRPELQKYPLEIEIEYPQPLAPSETELFRQYR